MHWLQFLWTEDAIEHVAEHGVSQEEFEYVFCNRTSVGYSRSSGLPVVWGYTTDGRYLMIVYEKLDDGMILPVTAYEVPAPR